MKRYLLEPMDYALFRDARPFNPDELSLARSLGTIPIPRTVYGMLRALLVQENGIDPASIREIEAAGDLGKAIGTAERAGSLAIRGPFLGVVRHGAAGDEREMYLPCPADAIAVNGRPGYLRPRRARGIGNWPEKLLPLAATVDGVEASGDEEIGAEIDNRYLRTNELTEYLTSDFFRTVQMEAFQAERHIGIERNPETFTTVDGMLYGVEFARPGYRDELARGTDAGLKRSAHYVVEIDSGEEHFPDQRMFTLGGERRPFRIETLADLSPLDAPDTRAAVERHLTESIKNGICRFRLYLLTPALFRMNRRREAWVPDFLDPASLEDSLDGVKYTLKSAAISRSFPVSGWNMAKGAAGARAGWQAVPAGAVYFIEAEAVNGNSAELANAVVERFWLKSICENAEDQRMGFGCVLVGGYDYV